MCQRGKHDLAIQVTACLKCHKLWPSPLPTEEEREEMASCYQARHPMKFITRASPPRHYDKTVAEVSTWLEKEFISRIPKEAGRVERKRPSE